MKRLILMRHAKSDWSSAALADHDRPLNRRGRLAAALMAAWLREEGLVPDAALVSSAARTRETWSLLGFGAEMRLVPALYNASPEAMLEAARAAPESARTALILGHMPAMQETANRMLGAHRIETWPTAKVVALEFPEDTWFEIGFGGASLVAGAAPKDLV